MADFRQSSVGDRQPTIKRRKLRHNERPLSELIVSLSLSVNPGEGVLLRQAIVCHERPLEATHGAEIYPEGGYGICGHPRNVGS